MEINIDRYGSRCARCRKFVWCTGTASTGFPPACPFVRFKLFQEILDLAGLDFIFERRPAAGSTVDECFLAAPGFAVEMKGDTVVLIILDPLSPCAADSSRPRQDQDTGKEYEQQSSYRHLRHRLSSGGDGKIAYMLVFT